MAKKNKNKKSRTSTLLQKKKINISDKIKILPTKFNSVFPPRTGGNFSPPPDHFQKIPLVGGELNAYLQQTSVNFFSACGGLET